MQRRDVLRAFVIAPFVSIIKPLLAQTPTTVVVDHQPVTITDGPHDIGQINLPDGLDLLVFRIARCTTATPSIWPLDTQKMWFNIYISYDTGATWKHLAGTGERNLTGQPMTGGIVPGPHSAEAVESKFTRSGLIQSLGRQIKGTVYVEGGPIPTNVTVEVG